MVATKRCDRLCWKGSNEMGKVCNKCKADLPEKNFSKACNTRDGLQYTCKDCKKAYGEAHSEICSKYNKKYYADHKKELLDYSRTYKEKNRETISKKYRAWYINNKDVRRKAHAMWTKNNSDAHRIHKQTRKARNSGVASTLTTTQWKSILDAFSGQCAYCGAQDKAIHQDHFISLSSGGEYTHNNILPACKTCNSSKGPKDFFTWYPTSDVFEKHREKRIMKFLHYTGEAQQLTLCTT